MHDDELETRLRADARAWRDAPTPAATARLHAAIAELSAPRRSAWRVVGALATAAALVALYAWSVRAPEPAPQPAPARHPKVAVDAAIAPLEHELVALADDASTLAGAVWQGVPRPLRELFRE
jgi:hypothetical protein